jgi:hypothetical protein
MRAGRSAIPGVLTVRGTMNCYADVDSDIHFPLDFSPNAAIFAPHQFDQIILSDIGILIWLLTIVAWTYQSGFSQVLRVYLVPYLWSAIS